MEKRIETYMDKAEKETQKGNIDLSSIYYKKAYSAIYAYLGYLDKLKMNYLNSQETINTQMVDSLNADYNDKNRVSQFVDPDNDVYHFAFAAIYSDETQEYSRLL